MEELYGDFYVINACDKYPIDSEKLTNLVRLILENSNKYEARFFRVSNEEFKYENAMENLYDAYIVTENLMEYIAKDVFYEISFEMKENLLLRVVHEYLDDVYYGILLVFSVEQMENRFTEKEKTDYLEEMEKIFYSVMSPIYGTAGIEAAVESLKVKEPYIVFEELYINNRIYNVLKKELGSRLEEDIKILDLPKGYIVSAQTNLEQEEEIIWNAIISAFI